MSSFQLQADMYNSISPNEIKTRDLEERIKELETEIEHLRKGKTKGVWVHVIDCPTNNKLAWFSCSNCNAMEKLDKDDIKAKYCWKCGAYMGVDNK